MRALNRPQAEVEHALKLHAEIMRLAGADPDLPESERGNTCFPHGRYDSTGPGFQAGATGNAIGSKTHADRDHLFRNSGSKFAASRSSQAQGKRKRPRTLTFRAIVHFLLVQTLYRFKPRAQVHFSAREHAAGDLSRRIIRSRMFSSGGCSHGFPRTLGELRRSPIFRTTFAYPASEGRVARESGRKTAGRRPDVPRDRGL